MTIEQLRKEITVIAYSIMTNGIHIDYEQNNISKHLILNPEECARQLSAIGSIDSWEQDASMFSGIMIYQGTTAMNWNAFVFDFKLSQYEALTLAIRNEYELSIEKDSNMMDLTKSINKLNKLK